LPKICADKHAGCKAAAATPDLCNDERIVEVCPSSCGQCRKKLSANEDSGDIGLNGNFQCQDTWDFCSRLIAGCENSSFIQENCRFTCKTCFVSTANSGEGFIYVVKPLYRIAIGMK